MCSSDLVGIGGGKTLAKAFLVGGQNIDTKVRRGLEYRKTWGPALNTPQNQGRIQGHSSKGIDSKSNAGAILGGSGDDGYTGGEAAERLAKLMARILIVRHFCSSITVGTSGRAQDSMNTRRLKWEPAAAAVYQDISDGDPLVALLWPPHVAKQVYPC